MLTDFHVFVLGVAGMVALGASISVNLARDRLRMRAALARAKAAPSEVAACWAVTDDGGSRLYMRFVDGRPFTVVRAFGFDEAMTQLQGAGVSVDDQRTTPVSRADTTG